MADSLCISHFVISVFHLKQYIHNTLLVQGCGCLRVNMPGFTYVSFWASYSLLPLYETHCKNSVCVFHYETFICQESDLAFFVLKI